MNRRSFFSLLAVLFGVSQFLPKVAPPRPLYVYPYLTDDTMWWSPNVVETENILTPKNLRDFGEMLKKKADEENREFFGRNPA